MKTGNDLVAEQVRYSTCFAIYPTAQTNTILLLYNELQFFCRIPLLVALIVFYRFTGLAYSDVKNLTVDRLQTFFDGNLWIITRRKKTNTESNIRLLDVPKRIIEKYKGLARDGHVFPVPSNGSCNKILKDIGRQCGFKVRLTYHVARHTNATTVLLSHGVPIETVSRLLGHTNIKTTQIYAKITAQKISQDMETLSHKLEDMEKNICRAI